MGRSSSLVMMLIMLLVVSGCRIYEDSNIKCSSEIEWDGEKYLECDIWISKIVEGYEIGHWEIYDCNTTDIDSCCLEIKQHMKERKDNKYYREVEDIDELPCKKRWFG